jgi:type II secretory pathway component PulK
MSHELERLDRVLSRNRAARMSGTASVTDKLLASASYSIDGRVAQVTVSDPAARVNLNLATERQLLALFASTGIDELRAGQIANDILSRRDTSGTYLSPDANQADPIATFPKARPFAEVSELSLLSSIDAATFDRLAPFLTVYGDGRVNINLAPAVVLLTLPGLDRESVAMILARRKQTQFRNAFEIAAILSTDSRARLQAQFAGFVDAICFTPRDLLLEASTEGLPGRLVVVVRLEGGAAWTVERTVER